MIALAFEDNPKIVSPIINLSCATMNNLLLSKSSVNTVEVAFDVCPCIISPLVNLPKEELSKSILSPSSKAVISESIREPSKINLLSWPVSVSNCTPSVVWTEVTDNSAASINV